MGCDAECWQGQEVVGGLGPAIGRCVRHSVVREPRVDWSAVKIGKVLLVLTPREVLLFEHCALHSCSGFASEVGGGAVSLGCGVIFRESMRFTHTRRDVIQREKK